MSITLTPPLPAQTIPAKPVARAGAAVIPAYIYAISLASVFAIVGIMWDISWHKSIGRDRFLSPPHILIYLAAIFAGLFSGIQVIWLSFFNKSAPKEGYIKVWGIFYSSLGGLFCIWGSIAMLTSAPFDDWWHNAYGLDVKILSPPHSLLAMGLMFLPLGALVSISRYLNRTGTGQDFSDRQVRLLKFLFVISASTLLCMMYILGTEHLYPGGMRHIPFYIIVTFSTMLVMPAFGRALRLKWGMTAIALGYFLLVALSNWILQLFPAEPKLGPILTHITHFQPAQFPLMIWAPALCMDLVMQRSKAGAWTKALLLSAVFVLALAAVQYPLSGFLLSPGARNWVFGANTWYYAFSPNAPYRFRFNPANIAPFPMMAAGLLAAIVLGTLLGRLSLRWGRWLLSIQR
jgi:hypothetical protein